MILLQGLSGATAPVFLPFAVPADFSTRTGATLITRNGLLPIPPRSVNYPGPYPTWDRGIVNQVLLTPCVAGVLAANRTYPHPSRHGRVSRVVPYMAPPPVAPRILTTCFKTPGYPANRLPPSVEDRLSSSYGAMIGKRLGSAHPTQNRYQK
jgi:hypothetical protein